MVLGVNIICCLQESDTPFEIDKSQIEPLNVLKKAQEETGIRKKKAKNCEFRNFFDRYPELLDLKILFALEWFYKGVYM